MRCAATCSELSIGKGCSVQLARQERAWTSSRRGRKAPTDRNASGGSAEVGGRERAGVKTRQNADASRRCFSKETATDARRLVCSEISKSVASERCRQLHAEPSGERNSLAEGSATSRRYLPRVWGARRAARSPKDRARAHARALVLPFMGPRGCLFGACIGKDASLRRQLSDGAAQQRKPLPPLSGKSRTDAASEGSHAGGARRVEEEHRATVFRRRSEALASPRHR